MSSGRRDSGLAATLLGVREASRITAHPLHGALFENRAITEFVKAQCTAGPTPSVHVPCDKQGHEIDAVVTTARGPLVGVRIKAGTTIASDFLDALDYRRERSDDRPLEPWLVYGGTVGQRRERGRAVAWRKLDALPEAITS